jgi:uncharacterized protein YjiS (DUF1127 family)
MESAMHVTSVLRPARTARPRLTARGALGFLAALDARHRARRHLAELDDRMLRDIGVSRADVAAELRRPLLR